ncbi:MAG: NAD(+) synthase [Anaerolineaceae bacterium]|nr:NAD(+) synthase [Anaerolineaceae bacterium]
MNHTTMEELNNELEIDSRKEEGRIIEFIQASVKRLHKYGAVIGLSGGLDSSVCAYLLERALGKEKVLALLLPERDSSSINHDHAQLVARTLGLETIERNMTKVLEDIGVYEIGGKKLKDVEEESKYVKKIETSVKIFSGGYIYHNLLSDYYGEETSRGWKLYEKITKKAIHKEFAFQFAKVRLRMVYLYFYADQHNYAVTGTTDKSEYSTSIYCKYGDGANDIQILRHLYKTQIRQLARYLKLPCEIIDKPNSGDLYGNLPHTANLGMSYEELDTLLYAIDKGYPIDKLTEIIPKKGVESIIQLKRVADLVKKLPLSIDGP